MPIYTDKLQSQQFKVVTKIGVKDFEKLLNIFKKAKETFPYKNKYYFLSSIELDEAGKSLEFYELKFTIDYLAGTNYADIKDKFPFISKFYNDPKLNINDYNYILMMESLIAKSNELLRRSKYKNYKFDIVGSWTNGKVIILEEKK